MWVLAVAWLGSAVCLVHLWRRRDASRVRKALWTVLLVLPILGPLFYGSLFRPLEPGLHQSTRDGVSDAINMDRS